MQSGSVLMLLLKQLEMRRASQLLYRLAANGGTMAPAAPGGITVTGVAPDTSSSSLVFRQHCSRHIHTSSEIINYN